MAQANLGWLHIARLDLAGARRHIETGLSWAGRIAAETLRAETEAKLLPMQEALGAWTPGL